MQTSLKPSKFAALIHPKRSYNTIIERQTNYALENMDTTGFINFFEGLTISNPGSLPGILFATQIGLRLFH